MDKYLNPLRAILVFSLLTTTLHYAHNVIRAAGYPQIPAFWFATIFTDTAAALALWVFVTWAWSVLNHTPARDQVSTQH